MDLTERDREEGLDQWQGVMNIVSYKGREYLDQGSDIFCRIQFPRVT
jgi:hypothetical protein